MKKRKTEIPAGAPKPSAIRGPKVPVWSPRQSKAPQTRIKPRDTSGKSGQRGK